MTDIIEKLEDSEDQSMAEVINLAHKREFPMRLAALLPTSRGYLILKHKGTHFNAEFQEKAKPRQEQIAEHEKHRDRLLVALSRCRERNIELEKEITEVNHIIAQIRAKISIMETGFYVLPGGKFDSEEEFDDPKAALFREVHEETNLHIDSLLMVDIIRSNIMHHIIMLGKIVSTKKAGEPMLLDIDNPKRTVKETYGIGFLSRRPLIPLWSGCSKYHLDKIHQRLFTDRKNPDIVASRNNQYFDKMGYLAPSYLHYVNSPVEAPEKYFRGWNNDECLCCEKSGLPYDERIGTVPARFIVTDQPCSIKPTPDRQSIPPKAPQGSDRPPAILAHAETSDTPKTPSLIDALKVATVEEVFPKDCLRKTALAPGVTTQVGPKGGIDRKAFPIRRKSSKRNCAG
jgi:hypothetical protein